MECLKSAGEKFPLSFTNEEDNEILLNSFNSNWNCNCKAANPKKSRNYLSAEVSIVLK